MNVATMALRQMLLNSRSYKFCCSASRGPPKLRRGLLTQVGMQVWVSRTSHHHQTQQTIILRNSSAYRLGILWGLSENLLCHCCTHELALHLCNYSWAQTKQMCLTVHAATGHLSVLRFTCWQLLHWPKRCAKTEYCFHLAPPVSLRGWDKDPPSRSLT